MEDEELLARGAEALDGLEQTARAGRLTRRRGGTRPRRGGFQVSLLLALGGPARRACAFGDGGEMAEGGGLRFVPSRVEGLPRCRRGSRSTPRPARVALGGAVGVLPPRRHRRVASSCLSLAAASPASGGRPRWLPVGGRDWFPPALGAVFFRLLHAAEHRRLPAPDEPTETKLREQPLPARPRTLCLRAASTPGTWDRPPHLAPAADPA